MSKIRKKVVYKLDLPVLHRFFRKELSLDERRFLLSVLWASLDGAYQATAKFTVTSSGSIGGDLGAYGLVLLAENPELLPDFFPQTVSPDCHWLKRWKIRKTATNRLKSPIFQSGANQASRASPGTQL